MQRDSERRVEQRKLTRCALTERLSRCSPRCASWRPARRGRGRPAAGRARGAVGRIGLSVLLVGPRRGARRRWTAGGQPHALGRSSSISATGCWAAFDTDLLRVAAMWRGNGSSAKALAPGSYHAPDKKTPGGRRRRPSRTAAVWVANGIYPGWQPGERLSLDRSARAGAEPRRSRAWSDPGSAGPLRRASGSQSGPRQCSTIVGRPASRVGVVVAPDARRSSRDHRAGSRSPRAARTADRSWSAREAGDADRSGAGRRRRGVTLGTPLRTRRSSARQASPGDRSRTSRRSHRILRC